MDNIIGIDKSGNPFSMRRIEEMLQSIIDHVTKDDYIGFLEEMDFDTTEEDLQDKTLLQDFKEDFLSRQIFQGLDLTFFYVYSNGEVKEIHGASDGIFSTDSFIWNFPWVRDDSNEEKRYLIVECYTLDDQWECDATRTPLKILSRKETIEFLLNNDLGTFEIWISDETGNFEVWKYYDDMRDSSLLSLCQELP